MALVAGFLKAWSGFTQIDCLHRENTLQ